MNQDTADRGRDIKLFGALFILVGLVDVLIIEFFPTYALKLFGLTSEFMNQLEFGFHYLRTGFMAVTFLFLCYVAWRRTLFVDPVPPAQRLASSTPEVPS